MDDVRTDARVTESVLVVDDEQPMRYILRNDVGAVLSVQVGRGEVLP